MDINIAIIEAIKMYPAIYEKKGPLGKTVGIWKELEKMFAMPEKLIRDHWHGLLQNFCENFGFKYGDEMSFLLPHLGVEGVRTRKEWPHAIALAFNITQEDIDEIDNVEKNDVQKTIATDSKKFNVADELFLKILASKIKDMDTETKLKTKEDILSIMFP